MRNLLLLILFLAIPAYSLPTKGEVRRAMDSYRREHRICESCGKPAKPFRRMEVHHIHPQEVFPEEAATTANFIALCKPCHLVIAHNGNFRKYVENLREVLESRIIKDNKR